MSDADRIQKLEAKFAPATSGPKADYSVLADAELDRMNALLQRHVDGDHLVEREREELAGLESRVFGSRVSPNLYAKGAK